MVVDKELSAAIDKNYLSSSISGRSFSPADIAAFRRHVEESGRGCVIPFNVTDFEDPIAQLMVKAKECNVLPKELDASAISSMGGQDATSMLLASRPVKANAVSSRTRISASSSSSSAAAAASVAHHSASSSSSTITATKS
jgi:hypothetical protein